MPITTCFVDIDDVNEFTWLTPLQAAVEARIGKPDTDTIWIMDTQVCVDTPLDNHLIWQTRDNGSVGLAVCLREEHGKFNCIRHVADVSLAVRSGAPVINRTHVDMAKVVQHNLHSNNYRDGEWGTFRHYVINEEDMYAYKEVEHAYLNTLVRGDLSSLAWVESANQFHHCYAHDSRVLVNIHYAALNFRDIMIASGRLVVDAIPGALGDRDCLLGLEYSGRVAVSGQPVMGIAAGQACATSVRVHECFYWPIPDGWTMRQAATVPIAYCTVKIFAPLHPLHDLTCAGLLCAVHSRPITSRRIGAYSQWRRRRGHGRHRCGVVDELHRVHNRLEHVVDIIEFHLAICNFTSFSCLCSIFSPSPPPVGSDEKRACLQKRFPQLHAENFTNSRNAHEFEMHIRQQTQGRGVDLVLNSLAEEKLQVAARGSHRATPFCPSLQASLRCLGQNGRFCEIGKFDLSVNAALGMSVFMKNVSFHGILLDSLLDGDNAEWMDVRKMFEQGLKDKVGLKGIRRFRD
jgi:fatty acid synthase